jgi:geranylgeranyl pyrophosphate synthase
LARIRAAVDERLVVWHAPGAGDEPVGAACHAALGSPGKRLRAALVFLVAGAEPASRPELLDVACVVEVVHAASLVLDDLPCMDGAVLRRGRPTVHRQFGEAVAILAAFSLLSAAQASLAPALARAGVPPAYRESLGERFAATITTLCRGQAADLALGGRDAGLERLERIHAAKTGALFEFAAELGAAGAGLSGEAREAVLAYARNLGLAFQVGDDLLDVTAESASLGKDAGRDRALGRVTFVSVFDIDGATTLRDELADAAVAALSPLGSHAGLLVALAEHVRLRTA